jgi:hypothetical protein
MSTAVRVREAAPRITAGSLGSMGMEKLALFKVSRREDRVLRVDKYPAGR